MIKIQLKDGTIKEYEKGVSVNFIAENISSGLARNIVSASYNGEIVETKSILNNDGKLEFYSWENIEGKMAFWHSSSHVLAQVLEEFYPGIKLTIGPAIKNGFYYDVDLNNHKISDDDFLKIEKRFIEICREKHEFKLREVSKKEAEKFYKKKNKKYKL